MWLSRTINNIECMHLLVIEAKFLHQCTSCHNLIFARLVEHVVLMEHSESTVEPEVTGHLSFNLLNEKCIRVK